MEYIKLPVCSPNLALFSTFTDNADNNDELASKSPVYSVSSIFCGCTCAEIFSLSASFFDFCSLPPDRETTVTIPKAANALPDNPAISFVFRIFPPSYAIIQQLIAIAYTFINYDLIIISKCSSKVFKFYLRPISLWRNIIQRVHISLIYTYAEMKMGAC